MRYFILVIGFFLLTGFAHKFYVSITEVTHNAENASLEIAVKLFTDDLEAALEAGTTTKLWIGDPDREAPETDSLLARYFEERLTIEVNGEIQKANMLGKELEADVTWCYLEINNIPTIDKLNISNRLLTEISDEQKNIVHVYVGDKEKSLLLRRGKMSGEVTF